MAVSIPFAVLGLAVDNSLVMVSAAAIAGASQMAKEVLDLLESRAKWITFLAHAGRPTQTAGHLRPGP